MNRHCAAAIRSLPVFLSLFLAAGCDIKIVDQEVQLAVREDADRLDLLLIYRGLSVPDDTPEAIEKGIAIVERILSGRRELQVPGWPGHCDLDDPSIYDGLDVDTAGVLQSIRVAEVGAFLDDQGRLSGYQRVEVLRLSLALECLNRAISRAVLEDSARGPQEGGEELLDERSRELFLERAQSGLPWIRLEDNAFVVDLPLTRAATERLRRDVVDVAGDPERQGELGALLGLLAHLRSLEVADEGLVLAFGAPAGGVVRFATHDAGATYLPGLFQALEARGILPDLTLTLGDVRAMLGPR